MLSLSHHFFLWCIIFYFAQKRWETKNNNIVQTGSAIQQMSTQNRTSLNSVALARCSANCVKIAEKQSIVARNIRSCPIPQWTTSPSNSVLTLSRVTLSSPRFQTAASSRDWTWNLLQVHHVLYHHWGSDTPPQFVPLPRTMLQESLFWLQINK